MFGELDWSPAVRSQGEDQFLQQSEARERIRQLVKKIEAEQE